MKKTTILAALLSASALCALSATAFADEAPQGYVTFYCDKATIGQGLVCEPQSVPFYEGDTGIDVVQRAADVIVVDSEWGAYIEGFADTDTGAEIPAAIAEVCPEMFGRNAEGLLSAYDYTSESGWSWFLNDEYAMVGISDYAPVDGDVIQYRFTVYGYGCDLGVDNSSWGGAPALVEAVKTADLAKLAAASDNSTPEYAAAIEVLGKFGATQSEIDAAYDALFAPSDSYEAPEDSNAAEGDKTSPETGAEGIAAVIGAAITAGAAMLLSRKR